jgi:hypothetical protein
LPFLFLQVFRQLQCGFDVYALAGFVTPGQKNHDFATIVDEVHPVTWTEMYPQFPYPIADRFHITGMTSRQTFCPDQDACATRQIVQSIEPACINIGFADLENA